MKLFAYKNLSRFTSAQFAFSRGSFSFIMVKAFALIAFLVFFVFIDFGATQVTFPEGSDGSGSGKIKFHFWEDIEN